jgi:hypothetical protein
MGGLVSQLCILEHTSKLPRKRNTPFPPGGGGPNVKRHLAGLAKPRCVPGRMTAVGMGQFVCASAYRSKLARSVTGSSCLVSVGKDRRVKWKRGAPDVTGLRHRFGIAEALRSRSSVWTLQCFDRIQLDAKFKDPYEMTTSIEREILQ